MCSTVWYHYTCGHQERVVYRCRFSSSNATDAQINACADMEAETNGTWVTNLHELCHECNETARDQRRQSRRNSRAAPGTSVRISNSDENMNAINQLPATSQQTYPYRRRALRRAPRRALSVRSGGAQASQNQQQAWNQSYLGGGNEPRIEPAHRRNLETMIRPLRTNLLQNIDRIRQNGVELEDLTPTQIWRFQGSEGSAT